jgi:hypothetical protein
MSQSISSLKLPDPPIIEKPQYLDDDADKGADEFVSAVGVPFRFKRLKYRKPGESWILLVYGPSKKGKTFFAGTAGPRTLYVNTGEGLETLMSPAFTSRYPESKDMIVVDIRDSNPQGEADGFSMVGEAIGYALDNFPDQFDNVVLDDSTFFRELALRRAMQDNTAARKKGEKRESRMEEFVKADIADIGTEMNMIEWFLAKFIPLFKRYSKNFIMLAHERQVFGKPPQIGDEAPHQKTYPGFSGKTFPDKVPAYFDDVWHAEAIRAGSTTIYQMRTAGTSIEMAGTRHGGIFAPEERDPNFQTLLAKIKASHRG